MSKSSTKALLALVAGGLVASGAWASEQRSGEKELAKMLEGRKAGAPKQCIHFLSNANLTIIEGTALIYRKGKTLWVNVPSDPQSLNDSDAVLVRRLGSELCINDAVTTFDPGSGMYSGIFRLNEFVPYEN